MQIQILDSWLREHLKTKATPQQIAEIMSLKSASIERIKKVGSDFLYDIEVTTNRVDMMSVVGLAREAAVALSSEGISAELIEKEIPHHHVSNSTFPVKIINDPKLCKRVCAALLTVELGTSPQIIRDRLEASDIRSLNNVIDVTNYVMRELGHPMHAFDADKVGDTLTIREAKAGEEIITLDKKEHTLKGGEIVAENSDGVIIDLLGIMGLQNSSVSDTTKRVLLFIDNNDSKKIRDASMNLNIRTDAAVLNEKDVDPELGILALNRGVQLLQEIARGKLESKIFDQYPGKSASHTVLATLSKIQDVIGVPVSKKQVEDILKGLSFEIKSSGNNFTVIPPTYRSHEIKIPEDVIEEVARMYGYHKIPSLLPPIAHVSYTNLASSEFYFEKRVKDALKYWGFTEVYTYSLVSEDLLEVSPHDAVTLANPLSTDMTHLRTTLVPSLLQAVRMNKRYQEIKIFELAHVYHKRQNDLPEERLMLAGVVRKDQANFFEIKGLISTLLEDLGIQANFKKKREGQGAEVFIKNVHVGEIEVLDSALIDFELSFEKILEHATLSKKYTPVPKFPEAREDLRIIIRSEVEYETIVETIKSASQTVVNVELLDTYEDKKTFRITYQSTEKNLTANDLKDLREKVISTLEKGLGAKPA